MESFEKAIICLFDQNAPTNQKNSAFSFCEELKKREDIWKICFEKLTNSQNNHVKFWCLQTLIWFITSNSLSKLSEMDRKLFQQSVLVWIRDVLPKQDPSPFIKNKFAQLFICLVKVDYPHQWSCAFRDLLSLLRHGESVIEMFLRILQTLNEEIVSRHIQRSKEEQKRCSDIKDAMRADCIPMIVSAWQTILGSNHPSLTSLCLKVMPDYIEWIDISLVTTEKFCNLFFNFIGNQNYKSLSIECLDTIVTKGMDPISKMNLILTLRLPDLMKNIQLNSEDESEFCASCAKLCSSITCHMMEVIDKMQSTNTEASQKAKTIMEQLLPLCFKFFSDQEDEVSSNVMEAISGYVQFIRKKKKNQGLGASENQQIAALLQVIGKKARYTEDFNFDPLQQDEYENGFLEYRRELFVLFKNITRVTPDITKNFTQQILLNSLQNIKSIPFADLEVAISLFYHLGEMFSDEINQGKSPYFSNLFSAIITQNVSSFGHDAVTMAYFDTVSRYGKLISDKPQLIMQILQSFVDERGMRSKSRHVSARTCYLFVRFCKLVPQQLAPFVKQLFQYTKDILDVEAYLKIQNQSSETSYVEKMYIYEALSSILATDVVESELRIQIVEQLMKPILNQIDQIISKQLYKQDTPQNPLYSNLIAHHINAIGYLSKGFSKKSLAARPVPIFQTILGTVMRVLVGLHDNRSVTEKVMFYLHRMVDMLDSNNVQQLVPNILSQLFNMAKDTQQLRDVIVLFNQFVSKEKSKAFEVADKMFLPLVTKIFQLMDNGMYDQANSSSEEVRLKIELHKHYFLMVHVLIQKNCSNVFTSARNLPKLQQVLNTILQGCTHTSLHMVKTSLEIFGHCIQLWGGNKLPQFDSYIMTNIVPVLFKVPMMEHFDLDDAVCNNILSDISGMLKKTQEQCGEQFNGKVQQILQSMGLDSSQAVGFISQLQTVPEGDFTSMLKELFSAKRKC